MSTNTTPRTEGTRMETPANAVRLVEVPAELMAAARALMADLLGRDDLTNKEVFDLHMALASVYRLIEDGNWIVPKIAHDANSSVCPYILPSGRVRWDACTSGPDHARQFAAQILAAADVAEKAEEF